MAWSTSAHEGVPTTLARLRTSVGRSVPASKDTLCACSRYFEALFFGPLSNPCQGDFHLRRVSATSLQASALNCSTGRVGIAVDDVEDLTIAAEQLPVDGLHDECCAFISRNMDVDNSIMVPEGAGFHHLESVHKPDVRFLLAYSDDCDFPRLNPRNLADLLGSDDLKVRRQEVEWEAAILWVKERRQCLVTSLARMQASLMKSGYLKPVVLRKAFVYMHGSSKTIVQHC
ncbi:hypothetical protein HPB48_010140 [Haemaphysalis longicornis]|uniref:BTB domain-containing protein n=1 Tax=Haemaphysalis longicornis TaxID=44386 RepID=A0A9J6FQ61_HAELO|nr:hypothetical protein HPB48_010140 [Haemaphysalis longicornis]